MAKPNDIELKIRAIAEGVESITGLASELGSLDNVSEELRAEAGRLVSALDDLTRQSTVVEVFRQVSEGADKAATKFNELQQEQAGLATRQQQLESNLGATHQALEQVHGSTAELTAAGARLGIGLKETKALLDQQEQALKADEKAQKAATAAAEAGAAALRKSEDALKGRLAALKSAEADEKGLTRGIAEAERALASSSAALARNRDSVERARQEVIQFKAAYEQATAAAKAAAKGDEAAAAAKQVAKRAYEQARAAVTEKTDAVRKAETAERQHERALASVRDALASAQQVTGTYRGELSAAAVKVDEARQALNELKTAQAAATQATEQSRAAVAASKQAQSEAEQAIKGNTAAVNAAEKSARDLQKAVDDDTRALKENEVAQERLGVRVDQARQALDQQNAELERARNALRYAGVDASNLAEEEQRITRQTIEARNAISTFSQELREQRSALSAVEGQAQQAAAATRQLGDAQGRAAAQSNPLIAGLKHAGHAMGGFVAASVGLHESARFIQSILATGDQFERFSKQLNSTFGSAQAGEAAFQWVREFAKNTPLELQHVLDATVKLKNFGLDPMDGTLQALVDQNAKLGGSQEVLNRIILATGQAFAKGRLQGEELLQFAEAGVPVFDLLSKQLGKTTAEVIDMASKGELGRDVIKRLIEEIGKASAGAAADQMSTLGGLVSNLKDRYTEFLDTVAKTGVLDQVKDEVRALGEEFDDSAGAVDFLAGSVKILLGTLAALSGTVRISFNGITALLKSIAVEVADRFAQIAELGTKLPGVLGRGFGEAAISLRNTSAELKKSIEKDAEDITRGGEQLGRGVVAAWNGVNQVFGDVGTSAAAAADATTEAGEQAGAGLDKTAAAAAEAKTQMEGLAGSADEAGKKLNELAPEQLASRLKALQDQSIDLWHQLRNSNDEVARLNELIAELKAKDQPLGDLPAQLEAAAGKSEGLREQIAGVGEQIAAVRDEQFKSLGVDASDVLTGIDAKAKDLLTTFQSLASDPSIEPRLLTDAYQKLLSTLDSKEALTSLKESLQGIRIEGFETAKAVAAVEGKLVQVREAAKQLTTAQYDLAASADRRLEAERAAAAGSVAAAEESAGAYDQLRQSIGSAGMLKDLELLRQALNDAFAAGKVGAEDYQALLDLLKSKHKELKEGLRGISGFAQEIGQYYAAVNNQLQQLSEATLALFTRMETGISPRLPGDEFDQLRGKIEDVNRQIALTSQYLLTYATPGLGVLMEQTVLHANQAQRAFYEQLLAAKELQRQLETNDSALGRNVQSAELLADSFNLLDQQDLAGLRSAISDAQSRLDSLRGSAESTLAGLSDELDRLEGREEDIVARRRNRQREDIETQLAQARTVGDQQSVASLEEALRKLDRVRAIELESLRTPAPASAPSTPAPAASTSTPARSEITINIPAIGRSATVSASPSQAAALQSMLDELSRQFSVTV